MTSMIKNIIAGSKASFTGKSSKMLWIQEVHAEMLWSDQHLLKENITSLFSRSDVVDQ